MFDLSVGSNRYTQFQGSEGDRGDQRDLMVSQVCKIQDVVLVEGEGVRRKKRGGRRKWDRGN